MQTELKTWRIYQRVVVVSMILGSYGAVRVHGAQVSGAAPQTVSAKIATTNDLLDINSCTPDELKVLPGMGPAYAQRVIAGRPYTAKNQVVTRGILPAQEYERIKLLIIAHRVKR